MKESVKGGLESQMKDRRDVTYIEDKCKGYCSKPDSKVKGQERLQRCEG